jgi:hypothetical protein
VAAVTVEALSAFEGFDLVTLYLGASESPQRGMEVRLRLDETDLDVEVEVVPGGQTHDHLLVAVE